MTEGFLSLAIIAGVSAIVPILARAVPHRAIPETVFLLIAGAVLGPYVLGVISVDHTTTFMSELGLAFLFLLAGYEIDPKLLVSSQGKHGAAAWTVSFALGIGVVAALGILGADTIEGLAIAIALTTTALGTLLPILKERKLTGTAVGDAILTYGTWGELLPIIAMALLLTTRSTLQSLLVLAGLVVLCLLMIVFATGVRRYSRRLYTWISEGSQTTSQTYVRFTVFLLVSLVAFAEVFHLDIVLGAFAAGFVLRFLVPEENVQLEAKLDGIGHGFFIPLFFVVSGANINVAAIGTNPLMLVLFIALLLLVRAVPIFVSLSRGATTRDMASGTRVSISLYCTTALPLIVAVTSVATQAGAMGTDTASVLVSAGAVTVLVMPFLAMLCQRVADMHVVEAVKEISHDVHHAGEIVHDHLALGALVRRLERAEEHEEALGHLAAEAREHLEEARHNLAAQALQHRAAHVERVAQLAEEEHQRILRDYGRLVGEKAEVGAQDAAAGEDAGGSAEPDSQKSAD